jgi:membrane protein implicated in regulation of membrane protease activity
MSEGMALGEVALVIREIRPYDRGQIRFQKPILGDDTWESIADEEIKVGERVKVLSVEGNILKVGKV